MGIEFGNEPDEDPLPHNITFGRVRSTESNVKGRKILFLMAQSIKNLTGAEKESFLDRFVEYLEGDGKNS